MVDDRIEPWYQAILSTIDGRCVGVEVLARWHADADEVRPSNSFLGTVEALGLPSQFNQGWALNRLPVLLTEAGFPDRSLMVEITETALLSDIERTRAMLVALTDKGIRIALDDFGVGYSTSRCCTSCRSTSSSSTSR